MKAAKETIWKNIQINNLLNIIFGIKSLLFLEISNERQFFSWPTNYKIFIVSDKFYNSKQLSKYLPNKQWTF